jgi:hypothetical protein
MSGGSLSVLTANLSFIATEPHGQVYSLNTGWLPCIYYGGRSAAAPIQFQRPVEKLVQDGIPVEVEKASLCHPADLSAVRR